MSEPSTRCRAVLRQFEAAGVTRIYVQHPDRQDFAAVELLGRSGPLGLDA